MSNFSLNFTSIGHNGPKDRVQVQNRPIDLIPTIFRKDITAWICQNLSTKHLQSVEQIEAKSPECSGCYKRDNHNSVRKGEEKMDGERGEWEKRPSG